MIIKLANSNKELLQILNIQNENLSDNLYIDNKKANGFVTVKHSIESITKLNSVAHQIIAVENDNVIGYALAMLKEFKDLIPVLVPMFEIFEQIKYKNRKLSSFKYYVMGQICIANSNKRQGIFKKLYHKHREFYSNNFEVCLTEVSSSNIPSMKAHYKVGFKTIHTFKDNTDEWNILLWDWK